MAVVAGSQKCGPREERVAVKQTLIAGTAPRRTRFVLALILAVAFGGWNQQGYASGDVFEPDNVDGNANRIGVESLEDAAQGQFHTLHDGLDEDWLTFQAPLTGSVQVLVTPLTATCIPVVDVFEAGSAAPCVKGVASLLEPARLVCPCIAGQHYWIRVRGQALPPGVPPAAIAAYRVAVVREDSGLADGALGLAVIGVDGMPATDAVITLSNEEVDFRVEQRTCKGGYRFTALPPGDYAVDVRADGAACAAIGLTLAPGADEYRTVYLAEEGSPGAKATREWRLPASVTASPGQEVGLPISLDDASGVLGYYFILTFNGLALECLGVQKGTLSAGWNEPTVNTQPGRVTAVGANSTALTGAGSLAVVTFRVRNDAPAGSTVLHFDRARLNEGSIPVTAYDGAILVSLGGYLTVTIEPEAARTAGAQWRIDGGDWQAGGDTVGPVAPGYHTVSYLPVSGWITPPDEPVVIEADETTTTSGEYVRERGSLRVTIEPEEARAAGAQWRVGGGAWQDSGATVTGLPTGEHTVDFQALAGWYSPSAQQIVIAANTETQATGTYTSQAGSVLVILEPEEARAAGAQWRVDSGAWTDSGVLLDGVTTGQHSVSFKEVIGWETPLPLDVTVAASETVSRTASYACLPPAAPTTVSASDGTFPAVVSITWGAVSGEGITYQVWRGNSADIAAAAPISDWIAATEFQDATAQAPVATPGSGCSGGSVAYTYHFYHVRSRRAEGCESVPSTVDRGHRGTVSSKIAPAQSGGTPSATGNIGMYAGVAVLLAFALGKQKSHGHDGREGE